MANTVLDAREIRWHTRRALHAQHEGAFISITLRTPHTLRFQAPFVEAFDILCGRFERFMASHALPVTRLLHTRDADGPALHCAVSAGIPAKALAMRFEEEEAGGALMDIDVMDEQGLPLSRADSGRAPRACLVCGQRPAIHCVRAGCHSAHEVAQAFESVLQYCAPRANHVAACALKAMLFEVAVSPKPGLVDRFHPGAHRDMDMYTFLSSAAVLPDYLLACARAGEAGHTPPEALLAVLRPLGLMAEQAMLGATSGVNTHKGLIFSLGILCAAAGMLGPGAPPEALCALAGRIAAPAAHDVGGDTHGRRVQARYGAMGARGEAAAGFPSALAALPTLEGALNEGHTPDRAGIACLLHLMSLVEDSNVLHRGGRHGLDFMRRGAAELLAQGVPDEALASFAAALEAQGISPGGCADLLAICWFLHFVCQQTPLGLKGPPPDGIIET